MEEKKSTTWRSQRHRTTLPTVHDAQPPTHSLPSPQAERHVPGTTTSVRKIENEASKTEAVDTQFGKKYNKFYDTFRNPIIHKSRRATYKPMIITCPNCLSVVRTSVAYTTTKHTHISALLLCPIAMCCCPYIIPSCKMSHHFCPLCRIYLGSCDSKIRCCRKHEEENSPPK